MMSLHEAGSERLAPVRGLLGDIETQLDSDGQELAVLVEDARKLVAREGMCPGLSAPRAEVLARIDGHAEELRYRQWSVLKLVDDLLTSSRAFGAEDRDPWASPWRPPETDFIRDHLQPGPVAVSGADRRRQLARVLTLVGALLVCSGLLVALLGLR
jgi:hypothetical protein